MVSGCGPESVAAVERVDELVGPGPAGSDAEPGLSAGAGDLAGRVEQGVAEAFRLGLGEVRSSSSVRVVTSTRTFPDGRVVERCAHRQRNKRVQIAHDTGLFGFIRAGTGTQRG